jgi:hypothetical protein
MSSLGVSLMSFTAFTSFVGPLVPSHVIESVSGGEALDAMVFWSLREVVSSTVLCFCLPFRSSLRW